MTKEETTPLSAEEVLPIPDWIIKYDQSNHQSSAGKAIRFLMQQIAAMRPFAASQPSPQVEDRMKWVKASERLPEPFKLVYLRISKSLMLVGDYIPERGEYSACFRDVSAVNIEDGKYHYGAKLPSHEPPFENIEWLEEPLSTLTSIK